MLFVISDTAAHSDQMQWTCCSPSEFHVHTLIPGINCSPSVTLIAYVCPLRPRPKLFFYFNFFSHISFAITAHKKTITIDMLIDSEIDQLVNVQALFKP